ncbi:MAG: heme o synthase [Leptospiraceae bacterium]|nr:heme o synthase [Leptospiraceae bacterium]
MSDLLTIVSRELGIIWRFSKPRMWFAIAVTVIPGMLIGSTQWPAWPLLLATVGGTTLVAISAFIFNQIREIDTDALMKRTSSRPLPQGSISVARAAIGGLICLITGSAVLFWHSGALAALFALLSFFVYIFIYTILLKKTTVWNTLIGGFAGAVGPLIGEAAVSQQVSLAGWLLFALIFVWQPPHFWALAIRNRADYERAGIRMLPVVHGVRRTWMESLVYQVLLVLLILLAWQPLGIFRWQFWLLPAMGGGLVVLWRMWQLFRRNEDTKTMDLFFMTILHLLTWNLAAALDLINRPG